MLRWLACALVALSGFVASVRAAELRITFEELTRLVQTIATDAKVYLNNAPGGLFTSESYIAITPGQQYQLPLPVTTFRIAGSDSTYAYHVNDMGSTSIRVSPVNGALRLTLAFEMEGPEAVGRCVDGDCRYVDVLPDIEWTRPLVNIDFIPVQFNGSVSLKVTTVTIGGIPRAVCKTSVDLLSRTACTTIGLPVANRKIAKLKADLPKILKDQINQATVQQQFADGLKKHLTVGQAGAVAINSISIAPKGMTVNFRFSAAGAN
jgi:hypothetical protein